MQEIVNKTQIASSIICGLLGFISVVFCSDSFTTTTYVRKGGNFSLLCRVTGSGLHMWHKDGKVIQPDSANRYHLKDSPPYFSMEEQKMFSIMELKVQEADAVHTGEYRCNSNYSQRVVVVTENMIQTNEDEPGLGKVLIPDEPLLLYCNTTECAHCEVVWSKDGRLLHPAPSNLEIFKNNTLLIKHATYNDTGVYNCAIDRSQLDVALNASIVVQSTIKLEKFDQSSTVVQGSPLELFCVAKGSPTPIIKWFVGGQEIYEDDNRIGLLEHNGLKKGKFVIPIPSTLNSLHA